MSYTAPLVTTSAALAAQLSDETGSGAKAFGTSPTFVTPVLGTPSSGTLTSCGAATDSVAGIMTAADHTTLTSLIGPATGVVPPFIAIGIQVTGWKSGIDLKTNAATTLFTLGAGRKFVCKHSIVVVTAVTSGAAVAFVYKILENGAAIAMSSATAATSTAPAIGQAYTQTLNTGGGPFTSCGASGAVQISITTGFTTSTTVTGQCFVRGFYCQ